MSTIENTRDEEKLAYERTIGSVGKGETVFRDHPGFGYAASGFGDGYTRGFQVSAGAAHAALSLVIGNIDAGTWDLEQVKESLIGLRNHIVQEAGL